MSGTGGRAKARGPGSGVLVTEECGLAAASLAGALAVAPASRAGAPHPPVSTAPANATAIQPEADLGGVFPVRRPDRPHKAEGVGFEPTMSVTTHSGFQDRRHRPLGEPS